MGEVLCVARWDEKQSLQWLNGAEDRYLISVAPLICAHPRLYVVGDNLIAFQQTVEALAFLPFSYMDPDHPLIEKLFLLQQEHALRAADFADQGALLLTNYRHNLQVPCARAASCYGHFTGVTAVICGAGRSLKEAILHLKARRDKLFIIGCGAGVEALLGLEVKPHLAVHVDPDPIHTFSKTDVPLFFQLRTSHKVVAQYSGPKFLMAGAGAFPFETWLGEQLGLEAPADCGWSSVTRAAVLARALGCSRVHLVGVDFSGLYVEGAGIKQQEPRSDWVVAARWLVDYMHNHLEVEWKRGLEEVEYSLVPTFPAAEVVTGAAAWQTVSHECAAVQEQVRAFLTRLQALFPNLPSGDPLSLSILEKIDRSFITQKALNPIWNVWEHVFKREQENHADALTLHRVLLLKSLADICCAPQTVS